MSYFRERFSIWWKRDPVRGFICLTVVSAHLCFLLTLVFFGHSLTSKPKLKKLVVKTVTVSPKPAKLTTTPKKATPPRTAPSEAKKKTNPPQSAKTPASPPKQTAKTKPKPESKQIPSKSNPKPTLSKQKEKVAAAPPPVKKKPAAQPPEDLLKELEEKIAKIETKRDKSTIKSELSVPQKIEQQMAYASSSSQSSSSELEEDHDDYVSFLVGYLQEHLQLPDFGEVKIQISLRSDGSVEALRVIKTESEKNKKYLEENLPKLKFPSFSLKKNASSTQTFILTFCNEM
jgi:outer membrane biosynthesis protein TonB